MKLKQRLAPVSSISSMLLGGIVALVSTLSFVIDIITTRNPLALALDIVVMAISYLTVWQGIYYTLIDRIVKEKADDDWNYRIDPILKLLTETSGKVNSIEHEMIATKLEVKSALNYTMNAQDMDATKVFIVPGVSFKFMTKIIVMVMFTFSALVYILSYPLGIVHYFILVVYLVWWTFITAEYSLFGSINAWIWGLVPIMIIPTTGIILSSIYGINIMIGIFFLGMLIYVFSYYSWATFVATGQKTFDINPVVEAIAESITSGYKPKQLPKLPVQPKEQKMIDDEIDKTVNFLKAEGLTSLSDETDEAYRNDEK
jgi:hypothetical protein